MDQHSADAINELLGAIPDIGAVNPHSKSDIFTAAFDLYRETAAIANVVAHCYVSDSTSHPRDQAILVGLLLRIGKFMMAVMQLSDGQRDKGEVVLALNRSIIESIVNLKFLVAKDDSRFFTQFVEFSLGPERELHDTIQNNVQARGMALPIEERMLKSIDRVCRLSGVTIDQVRTRYGDWSGGIKERLKAIDMEDGYVHLQRIPSHAVHGSWVDLLLHFLDESGGGFSPRSRPTEGDPRLWLPVAVQVLECADAYLAKYFPHCDDLQALTERIDALRDRIESIDEMHEGWMSPP